MAIVLGIMISEAAKIVENGFRDVRNFDAEALASLSLDQKFNLYFNNDQDLVQLLDYVRTDGSGGLPTMSPPRTIQMERLRNITTGNTIRTLVNRLSDFSFFEIED